MKVLVFGASRRTGQRLVETALRRGHEVTALAPSADAIEGSRGQVRVLVGDVLDGGVVSDAVDGQEAVLVALRDAEGKSRPGDLAQGTLNVIRSMQRYRVRRLIVLSGAGARPGADPNQPWLRERVLRPLFHRRADAELRRMEIIVRQSELDWTLVRAGRLVDGPARGGYRVGPGFSLPGDTAMTRADVAAFMVDELERGDNVAHAVAIASRAPRGG